MTQDEKWATMYDRILTFIKTNKRRPSKYHEDEKEMHNWLKHNKKLLNQQRLRPTRLQPLNELFEIIGKYRRVNQHAYLNNEEELPLSNE